MSRIDFAGEFRREGSKNNVPGAARSHSARRRPDHSRDGGVAVRAEVVRGIYAMPEAAVEGARDLLPAL
jgi:hypothetical protein